MTEDDAIGQIGRLNAEIAGLRAQNSRMREALTPFSKISGVHWVDIEQGNGFSYWLNGKWVLDARAALANAAPDPIAEKEAHMDCYQYGRVPAGSNGVFEFDLGSRRQARLDVAANDELLRRWREQAGYSSDPDPIAAAVEAERKACIEYLNSMAEEERPYSIRRLAIFGVAEAIAARGRQT